MHRILPLFLLLVFWCVRTFSQVPFFEEVNFTFHNSPVKIQKLLKDKDGWMFFGTDKGLFRYDGIAFKKIESVDTLKDETVTALFQNSAGIIWVGFRNGAIAMYNGKKMMTYKPEEGLPKVPVTCFAETNDGILWFGTNGEGIYCISDKRIYNFNTDDGLNDNYIHDLQGAGKNILSASDQGLIGCSMQSGKKIIAPVKELEQLPDNIITALMEQNKTLVIGTQDKGICAIIRGSDAGTFISSKDWIYGMVNNVAAVGDEYWIATDENGLVITDTNCGFRYNVKSNEKFPHTKIKDLVVDNEGNVWLACSDGLSKSPGKKFQYFDSVQGTKIAFVHSIMVDSQGTTWFTPDQGLMKMWKNASGVLQSTLYTITPANQLVDIVTLYEDPFGYLWIGTMGGGVYRLFIETGKVIKVTENPALVNGSILTISGNSNDVWIGGFDGTTHCIIGDDPEKIRFAPNAATDSLGTSYIYSIYTDKQNRTWFGTDGDGVCMYNGSSIHFFTSKEGMDANTIYTILEDDSGLIWFNTQDKGIYSYDGKKFSNYSLQEGLSDAVISSMIFDKHGNLYLIHKNGADILERKSKRFTYIRNPELLSNVNADLNSITLTAEGNILAGTEKFILQLSPESISQQPFPKTFLEEVSVFQNRVDSNMTFSSDQNNFSFAFNGLWYSNPSLIQYQYKLDGFNDQWLNTTDREVNFPKLSPGSYTFRVRSSLNNDFRDAVEAHYSFVIEPPFWKTLWFQLLTTIAVALLLYTFIRWRDRRIRKMDRLRKESAEFQFEMLKSQVNPHFLFNSFNTLITIIEDDKKTAVDYVEKLSEFFRSIVAYRDQNLILLSEEIKLLHNYFFLQKKRYGQHLTLEINIDPAKENTLEIPPLTLQLLMENAIKHNAVSKESPLTVRLSIDSNNKLVIENNINPKIKSSTSSGMGLQNITNRYRLLTEEEVEIVNDGKTFTVKIPLIPT